MNLFLSKLLPLFVYPLGAALVLALVALALGFTRLRRLARALAMIAAAGLWVASTPAFSFWVVGRLEAEYPPRPIAELPTADAVIVLGGTLAQPLPPRQAPDLQDAADRIVHAARLYRAGKAPRIVVSGGNVPFYAAVAPEAEFVADFLIELGVPREALVLEGESRNTHENAVLTARLFAEHGWTSALLVTSGAHMPRALASFRKAGLDPVPAATDIVAPHGTVGGPFAFLPDATALAHTTGAVKEIIGGVVYRLRGWT